MTSECLAFTYSQMLLQTAVLETVVEQLGLPQPTPIEELSILTSGDLPGKPGQLLGSERLRALVGDLEQQYDLIVIDSPPVLPVAETMLMASQVNGVLLVLNAGHTRRGAARQAARSLRQMGANLLGAVLNATPSHSAYYYHAALKHRAGIAAGPQSKSA